MFIKKLYHKNFDDTKVIISLKLLLFAKAKFLQNKDYWILVHGMVFIIPDIGYRVLGVLGLVLLSPGPDPRLKLRYSRSFTNWITLTADWTWVQVALSKLYSDCSLNLLVVPAIYTTVDNWLLVMLVRWIIFSIIPSHFKSTTW